MLNIIAMICSFIVSTTLSVMIMRNTERKWLGVLSALVINAIILGVAYLLLHDLDDESRLFGIDFQARYVLVMSIPVITWINFIIISIVRNSDIRARI